ncbi:molybdopterin oxidoreductase family protein [Thermus thermophilus]|uniref:molybdopterin oxidoreductase family protein n=1 Tax=Thermus thermophilus TaxID=274 RepID=UPI001FCA50CF|nr:molybdopterin oxidoreductase family protein [Thermus thermophilus]
MRARATCPLDCPDACSLLLTLEEGRLLRVEGDPRHPITQGFACAKTYRYPERVRERLLYPLRRVGRKGEGRFVRVSWEEALDGIAKRLMEVLDREGGEAVLPYHYAGTMGLVENQHPLAFFRAIGASELLETICATAGSAAWEMTYGPRLSPDPEDIPENARYILLWGINSLSTNSHLTPFLKEAKRRGAKVVHIDPYENLTSRFADLHLKLRPGTDAALAYALAHVLFREGLLDWEYLGRVAVGLEEFQKEAEKWTPERASALTGVPEEAILRLAREMGEAKRVFLRVGYGMTRHPGGGNALRAVVLLPALLGAWRYPGCGAMLSTSGAFPLNKRFLGGRHLLEGGHPHQGYFRPNPKARAVNMNQLGTALTELDPPIRVLFVFNTNPLVVAPNTGKVRAGLAREDLFTVVLEQVMTETARFADYLLPATLFYEHPDLYTSYGHYYLSWNEPLSPPAGEARPNTWVFRELAKRLGLKEPTLYWTAEEVAESLLASDHPYLEGITLERLKREGFVKLNLPRPFLPFAEGPVRFSPPPEVIPTEPLPEYPLILLTPPAHRFLNTTYGDVKALVEAEGGEPRLLIHPEDAEARGIRDGMLVHIRSPWGRITRKAHVTEAPIPGTVVLEGTWWEKWAPDGKGVNHLTSERLTDLGGGSTFHSTPVEVEPLRLA